MKKLITIIAMFISLQANAGFINLTVDNDYNQGDFFDVYLTVSNPDQEIAEVEFDVLFDDSMLAFDSFTFNYGAFSWDPMIEDVDLVFSDVLNIYALWEFPEDLPLGDFDLGFITFEALSVGTADFGIDELFIGGVDINDDAFELFNDSQVNIDSATVNSVEVPEPPVMALFGLALLVLARSRKQT